SLSIMTQREIAASCALLCFSLLHSPPPRSTLFPYTTLFRSRPGLRGGRVQPRRRLPRTRHDRRLRRLEPARTVRRSGPDRRTVRSEEHTSELQSQSNLVCRLLLEKKKTTNSCLRPSCLHPST